MTSMGLTRELIALRVARELRDGMVVNLGIGIPTLVSDFIPDGRHRDLPGGERHPGLRGHHRR